MRKAGKTSVKESIPQEGGLRKWWMGLAAMGAILVAGILMLAFGKMNDTVFGLWIGGMTADVFSYATANVVTKKITKEQ